MTEQALASQVASALKYRAGHGVLLWQNTFHDLRSLLVWLCALGPLVCAGCAGFCAAQRGVDTSVVVLIALFLPGFQALLCRSKEL